MYGLKPVPFNSAVNLYALALDTFVLRIEFGACFFYNICREIFMSDGREEREEREKRLEQEARENREDRIDRDHIEEWEPERVDS
jgi:hypothetical protein